LEEFLKLANILIKCSAETMFNGKNNPLDEIKNVEIYIVGRYDILSSLLI